MKSLTDRGIVGKYLEFASLGNSLLIIALLLAVSYLWKYIGKKWTRQMKLLKAAAAIPGPPATFFFGNLLTLTLNSHGEDLLSIMCEMGRRYKPRFRFWMGPELFIITSDPNDAKIILSSQRTVLKGDMYHAWESLVGDSVIITTDPNYKLRRKAVLATMNSETLTSFLDVFDFYSEKCANALESRVGKGQFDIMPFIMRCVNNFVIETVMSTSIQCENDIIDGILNTHHRMYKQLFKRTMSVWLHPDFVFFNTKMGKDCRNSVNLFRGFVQKVISEIKMKRNSLSTDDSSDDPRQGVMSQMIDWMEEEKLITEKMLLDDMTTVYAAALDPITEVASFTLLMLALHQDVQEKVRCETMEILNDGRVNASCLKDLKYLDMVIKETIRLFPIAFLLSRKVTGDVQLDSCLLPDGSTVNIFVFLLHRNPDYWEEPEKFIPERFMPENSAKRHPYAYIPFSVGGRSCIGQKFAVLSLKTIVANLVRRFRFAANGRLEDIQLKTDITIRSRYGHRLSISRV